MKKNMKKKCVETIYVADFETTAFKQSMEEKRTRVYLYEIMEVESQTYSRGVSIEQFMNYIASLEKEIIVYFHNLSFDGEFILWYLMEHNYICVDKVNEQPMTFETIITDTNSMFMIKVIMPNKNIVTFRCSYKVMPNSIDAIGKMFNIPKLHETHNYEEYKLYKSINDVTEEELMYIHNDVRILRELVKYLKDNKMMSISLSTNAYKFWKKDKFMLTKYQLIRPSDEICDIVDKSYRGGITKINYQYANKVVEDVISYDVNSLYPSVMYENSMPCGMGEIYNSLEDAKANGKKKFIIKLFVSDAKVLDGYQAFIGVGGFTFSSSYVYKEHLVNCELNLWEEEYNLFKICYDGDYKVVKVVGFDSANYVFKDYIDHWMQVKMDATTSGNIPQRQFAKLMLNSLYGKFGMNEQRYSKTPVGISDGEIVYNINDSMTAYYYKPIASYITSMARCKLVSAIIMCRNRFVYCDTDSIYLRGTEQPDGLPVDDVKLGYWKFEHHYNKFKGLKAKCYLKTWYDEKTGELKSDSSIAGLPKDARGSINFDNFQNGLKVTNGKKCKVKFTGGILIKTIDFTIKV